MTITQPVQPVQPAPTTPVQPVPAQNIPVQPAQAPAPSNFSSEPQMHTNAGEEGVTQVTVMLDKDSLKIIQDASMVHGESIVNLGIKLFSKTNVYKEFMLKAGTVPLDTSTEDLQTLSQAVADLGEPSLASTAGTTTESAVISAPSGGGFQQW